MIEVSIAHDEHFNSLPEFSQLLFLRLLPHTDDSGRISGSPKVVKARAWPMSEHPPKRFAESIGDMIELGLVAAYVANEAIVLQFKPASFNRINAVLIKNSTVKSEYLDPVDDKYLTATEYLDTWKAREAHVLARAIVSSKYKAVSSKQQVVSKGGVGGEPGEAEFDELWNQYPSKSGKKAAFAHFKASVKTPEQLANLLTAMKNYLASNRVKNGFVKNGSTWFNEWQDWIEPTNVMMHGANNGADRRSDVKDGGYPKSSPAPGKYAGVAFRGGDSGGDPKG